MMRQNILSVLALSLFGALAACSPQTTVHTSVPSATTPSRGIAVNGFGKAMGAPDIARASVGVEVRAATAEQAISDVNARMAQVVAALKQAGVADKDLRTSNVSLHFEQIPEPPRPYDEGVPAPAPEPTPRGVQKSGSKAAPAVAPAAAADQKSTVKLPKGFYRASNMLEVTIRNLDQAGSVLSAATNAGADQMYGIQFELEDPSKVEAEARQKAYADARARAERLADLAGVRLGPPVSISESSGGFPMPAPMMMKSAAAESANMPIERGELTITINVQVVFALPE